MLASATSGYPDWIQENPAFVTKLYGDPFRQWTTQQLLDIALARPLICAPGACFHYAHTNFNLLTRVIQADTGPARTATHPHLVAPEDPGARAARLHLRPRSVRGLDLLEPVVVHRRGHDHDRDHRGLRQVGESDRDGSADLAQGGARASRSLTARFPGFSRRIYYGLGIVVANTWQFQNPEMHGYTAIS